MGAVPGQGATGKPNNPWDSPNPKLRGQGEQAKFFRVMKGGTMQAGRISRSDREVRGERSEQPSHLLTDRAGAELRGLGDRAV